MQELVPEAYWAFLEAFKDGALPGKTKELMALGIAQIAQCPWCLQAHTQKAALAGASDAEIAETTFVATAMAARSAWSHGGCAPSKNTRASRPETAHLLGGRHGIGKRTSASHSVAGRKGNE